MNSKRVTSIVSSVRIQARIRSFSENINRISGNVAYFRPAFSIDPNPDPTRIVVSSCRMRKSGSAARWLESAIIRTACISSSRGRNDDFIPAMRRESAGVLSIKAGSCAAEETGLRAGCTWGALTGRSDGFDRLATGVCGACMRGDGLVWRERVEVGTGDNGEGVPDQKSISWLSPKIWSIK